MPGYNTYLILDEEMIARVPIVDLKSNLKMTQETLDRAYVSYQVDTFKIINALVYPIHFKMFTDIDTNVYVKQIKGTQKGQAVFFDIHNQFLGPNHVARQATETEGKLQNSHYDGERKMWYWNKYVALYKKQHVIMESLTDYRYSGMDNGTTVCHFLQGIALSRRQQSM